MKASSPLESGKTASQVLCLEKVTPELLWKEVAKKKIPRIWGDIEERRSPQSSHCEMKQDDVLIVGQKNTYLEFRKTIALVTEPCEQVDET